MHVADLRRFIDEQSGSISILGAVSIGLVLAAGALAIDVGSMHLERRQYQGAVDLAAMAAAADLAHAQTAANATLKANGLGAADVQVTVELGTYQSDSSLKPSQRFQLATQSVNAVRVTMTKPSRTYFARYFTHATYNVKVSAVAACDSLAAFSIGSRLLALNGGLTNAVLGGLFGSNLQLSVMDYDALANLNVQLFPFMDSLASELGLKAGLYEDVLDSSATVANVFSALAHVADTTADARTSSALTRLVTGTRNSNASVDLSSLLALGPLGQLSIGSQPAGMVAALNAAQILSGTATLADGTHQATVDLGAAVPGILSLKADIAVGERMQHSPYSAVGSEGAVARTAQTRVRLLAQIGGTGLLSGVAIRLPIYIDVAYAEGKLSKIACSGNGTGSVDVAVTPGVAKVWIGDGPTDMTDFSDPLNIQSAKLVDAPLAKIYGKAEVDAGNSSPTVLTFAPSEIGNGTIKQVDTSGLVQGVVTSLLKNLTLNVQVAGINIGLGSQLNALVLANLNSVAAPLDTVVDTLLSALGVHIGQADVTVDGVRCRGNGILSG